MQKNNMSKNLLIVESPAKAKTIEKILGSDFQVNSCYGHIRDLEKAGMGIDIENDFEPRYTVPDDKKKVELVQARNQAEAMVHSVKKSLGEHGDKLDAGEKSAIEDALKEPKRVDPGHDVVLTARATGISFGD